MNDHPLKAVIEATMEHMQSMANVKTVFGEPLLVADNSMTIVPVCRVSCGFGAGGTEFGKGLTKADPSSQAAGASLPFGGGAGGGVSLTPFAFLVIGQNGNVQAISLESSPSFALRLLDMAPQLTENLKSFFTSTQT